MRAACMAKSTLFDGFSKPRKNFTMAHNQPRDRPTWIGLRFYIQTPPFPSYTSGTCDFGAAAGDDNIFATTGLWHL
jgi:hypothetical protein